MEGLVVSSFWSGRRVFLTGHTGFKGSWLSLWLSELGAEVFGYSLAPATRPNLFEVAGVGERVTSVFADIRDASRLSREMSSFRPDVVIHMAAQSLVRPSYRDPVMTYATNVMGTVHVLDAARQVASVQGVLNVTSDKCYENQEWLWGYRENEPMGGLDPYSSSKGCSELVTHAYRHSYFSGARGLASARAGNVIGGGDWAEDRLVPDCMRALMDGQVISVRNPGSIRPWQHVLEPLGGYLVLLERLVADQGRFSDGWNFGPEPSDTRPVQWIADRIVTAWGEGARWQSVHHRDEQPHEANYLTLDCSKANRQLGWMPRLGLSQALDWVVAWYKAYQAGESMQAVTLDQIRRYQAIRP